MSRVISTINKSYFYAIFDSPLPGCVFGKKALIQRDDVERWRRGENVRFFNYDRHVAIEASKFRVIEEIENITLTENELSQY